MLLCHQPRLRVIAHYYSYTPAVADDDDKDDIFMFLVEHSRSGLSLGEVS